MSHGSAPMSSGFEVEVDDLLRHQRRERGVADADEAVVGEDLDDQPAVKRERAHRRRVSIGETTSIGLVQKCGGSGTVLPRHWTTRVRISVIFIVSSPASQSIRGRGSAVEFLRITRQIKTNAATCSEPAIDKDGSVAVPVVAQLAGDLAEQHAAHARRQARRVRRRVPTARRGNHVGRQDHHERRPRLLAEEREAEGENDPADGCTCGTNITHGIRAALAPSAILRDLSTRDAALQQPARESAADQAADARCGVRNPADGARRLDVEAERHRIGISAARTYRNTTRHR